MHLHSFFGPALALIIFAGAVHAHFAITGVQTGVDKTAGTAPPRRNINDLYNDEAQFSLYIQALNAFTQTDETTLTSYFQVAGMHGLPYISWDDMNKADGSHNNIGYCPHDNTLFPSWHRLELALYEQIVCGLAQTAAKAYNSAEYQNAADNLRMPWWDWADPEHMFPPMFTWETISITLPTGVQNVSNPLYQYKFLNHPEINNWFPASFLGEQPNTLRYPDMHNVSQQSQIQIALTQNGPSLTQQVWSCFAKTPGYNNMSTMANGGNSLEAPHSTVHSLVGGPNGHMADIAYSAFEPAFWTHHCNVDRLFEMWIAIYPDQTLQPETTESATWTNNVGDTLDANTPLTPFSGPDGSTVFTTASGRDALQFGYSYADVPRSSMTGDALKSNVIQRINQLYNSDGSEGTFPSRMGKRNAVQKSWSVVVAVPNGALPGPFSIQFTVDDCLVGNMVVLSNPGVNLIAHAEYSLDAVIKASGCDPSDEQEISKYLKGKLCWTVTMFNDGSIVDNKDVVGLQVNVIDEVVHPPENDSMFPTFLDRTDHPDIPQEITDTINEAESVTGAAFDDFDGSTESFVGDGVAYIAAMDNGISGLGSML